MLPDSPEDFFHHLRGKGKRKKLQEWARSSSSLSLSRLWGRGENAEKRKAHKLWPSKSLGLALLVLADNTWRLSLLTIVSLHFQSAAPFPQKYYPQFSRSSSALLSSSYSSLLIIGGPKCHISMAGWILWRDRAKSFWLDLMLARRDFVWQIGWFIKRAQAGATEKVGQGSDRSILFRCLKKHLPYFLASAVHLSQMQSLHDPLLFHKPSFPPSPCGHMCSWPAIPSWRTG